MRVFFATDIHGSETCWRKFLNCAPHYKADVVILGGDMTGKALVPVVHDSGESWHGTLQEQRRDLAGEEEVSAFEQDVMRRGYYPFLEDIAGILMAGRGLRGHAARRTRAAIEHAVAFPTWRSLTEAGLTDAEAVDVMRAGVERARHQGRARRSTDYGLRTTG